MYQLHHYLDMMTDEHRMVPLEAAIRKVVRPGDAVLDLGAGTGVLTFIALDAGAAHVYAVERSPAIEVARGVARANGLADRVTFIQADADTVRPPRLVDGLIGDVRGVLPLLGDNIDLFEKVRRRWLKPGGYTLPLADEIIVAPSSAMKPRTAIDGWTGPRREADYTSVVQVAANGFLRASLHADDILADGRPLGSIAYDGTNPRKLASSMSFVMARAGALTGLALWFRGTLAPGITFDTAPGSPPSVYGQAFLPLSAPRPVAAGETVDVSVTVHRTPFAIWGWKVTSARQPAWQESHSTLKSYLFGSSGVELLAGTRSPRLTEEGMIARHVLAAADGTVTARQLAEKIAAAFSERFPSADDALPAVVKVLRLYAAS